MVNTADNGQIGISPTSKRSDLFEDRLSTSPENTSGR